MATMERLNRIQILSPAVVNKIAAGEVIERPASVIKELLENSLDALCSRIDVDIEEGGTELIRIVDDGEGMLPEDLPLAVTSHATSKLRDADDLFRVQTMGFRGEALASIAEVSQFRIRSRAVDQPIGAELSVSCGKRGEIVPCGIPQGTQIEIRQLFCNTPVRRKFLKKAATEFGYISEQFSRVALACPRLQMTLTHNGKQVYRLPGNQQLRERIELFHGSALVEKLLPVETAHHGIRVWGYVGHPSLHKSTRKSQYLFLNGRYIQDRTLQHALNEAYRGLVMVGRHPVAFLFLEMPSDQVDVNVHPTKSEVRFRDSQLLFRMLLSTLRTKFLQSDLHSELTIRQPLPSSLDPGTQQRKVELDLVSWAKTQLEQQVRQQSQPEPIPSATKAHWPAPPGTAATHVASATATIPPAILEETDPTPPPVDGAPVSEASPSAAEQEDECSSPVHTGLHVEPVVPLGIPARSSIPALQVDDCYIVLSTDQGLTVIDQHALHERVLYERFRKKVLEERVEVQRLLVPLTLELSDQQSAALLEQQELLHQIGFGVEEFGRGTLAITSHPVFLGYQEIETVIREIAEKLEGNDPLTRRDLLDSSLHMMACKAAIKAGQRLTPEEIISLLAQRELVDDAHHCPHGRPTALVLSREELDRQFGRLGA
ncbi:MAG: DNA mismatch repair endonuclease MutL [Planctomycetaceae bacterium]